MLKYISSFFLTFLSNDENRRVLQAFTFAHCKLVVKFSFRFLGLFRFQIQQQELMSPKRWPMDLIYEKFFHLAFGC